jgi:two-component system, NarL family, response regulator YdfI
MTPPLPRVLVVATSGVLAARIEAVLRDHATVVAATGAIRAVGSLIEEHGPAVVVVASSTAQAAAALAERGGTLHVPPVVLVVDDPRSAWTATARRSGVRAVVSHDASADELLAAITAATSGLIALHPSVFRAVAPSPVLGIDDERALTPREREILEMMAEGLSNRAIARRLEISAYTVKFHVASILDKLRAKSRTEAVTLGLRRGLIAV